MGTIRDLSGNGFGVVVEQPVNNIPFATGDQVVPGKMNYLRATGAGNIIIRAPGAAADITIAAKDGEYVPVQPGSIVRQAGTTVTSLQATA